MRSACSLNHGDKPMSCSMLPGILWHLSPFHHDGLSFVLNTALYSMGDLSSASLRSSSFPLPDQARPAPMHFLLKQSPLHHLFYDSGPWINSTSLPGIGLFCAVSSSPSWASWDLTPQCGNPQRRLYSFLTSCLCSGACLPLDPPLASLPFQKSSPSLPPSAFHGVLSALTAFLPTMNCPPHIFSVVPDL